MKLWAKTLVLVSYFALWVFGILVWAAHSPGPAPPKPYIPTCNGQVVTIHYEPTLDGDYQGFLEQVAACPGPDMNYDPIPLEKTVWVGPLGKL